MNKPYISSETIRKINIMEIEKKKAKLKKDRDFLLEQQRIAFQKQQAMAMARMYSNEEEQEESHGMSM